MGSPSSFYIAMALNVAMILLEWIEGRLTRCHGGKQTPWDRFLFGQVPHGQLRTQHTSTCHARALWCGEGTELLRKRVDGTAWAAALPLPCRCPAAALPLPCRCARSRALTLLVRVARAVGGFDAQELLRQVQPARNARHPPLPQRHLLPYNHRACRRDRRQRERRLRGRRRAIQLSSARGDGARRMPFDAPGSNSLVSSPHRTLHLTLYHTLAVHRWVQFIQDLHGHLHARRINWRDFA